MDICRKHSSFSREGRERGGKERWVRTLSADSAEDYSPVTARDCAEEDSDHGEGDHPINIASIEELPAAFDSSPSLAGKHGEVAVQLLYCQNLYLDS